MHYKKTINSLRHFGFRMCVSKAWEKFIVDPYRFRAWLKRELPEFPYGYRVAETIPEANEIKPLSICYMLHYFFPDKTGGTERFVLNLAKQQQKAGMTVRVVSLGKRLPSSYSNNTDGILWEEFDHEGIPITQIRYQRAPRGLYYDAISPDDMAMRAFAGQVIERYQIDIVHFAYPQPFAAVAQLCQEQGIPYVVTLTDFNMLCHYATMVKKDGHFCSGSMQGEKCARCCSTYGVRDMRSRYRNAAKMLENAAALTVPSAFVARVFSNEFPMIGLQVIPHGISERFSSAASRDCTRNFVYAGTLSNLKGVHHLIGAFKKLQGAEYRLDIYGSGDAVYTRKLKSMATNDRRIHFHGNVAADEIAAAYQRADCIVVPSTWYETYNFVLREALSCGCIAVAADIGAMPEAVVEGRNGYLFRAGDRDSLRLAMERAAAFDWKDYSVLKQTSLEEESSAYTAIYQACMEGR